MVERGRLTARQFSKLARQNFSKVLGPRGFSCEASKHCTFYRQVSDDVWHFVFPDRSRRLPQYDVRVFPLSPRLISDFDERFPDGVDVPPALNAYLHSKTGIKPFDQEWFWCRTENGFLRDFNSKVRPTIEKHLDAYLDRFQTLADLEKKL